MTQGAKRTIGFGPFEADLETGELRKSGVRLKLGGQPFEVLAALLERPGQLVTREEMRKRLWSGDTFVDFGHGLSTAVNKLREALGDSAGQPRYIETLPRRGYRFIGKVGVPQPQEVPPVRVPRDADSLAHSLASVPVSSRHETAEPEWAGTFIDEEWQATVPVKRQTLINLWTLLPVAVILALVLAGLWSRLSAPSPEERERALKLAAEHAEPWGSRDPAIWRAEVSRSHEIGVLKRIISDRDSIGGPQPSPDGRKLVYMAGTLHAAQIWVCNSDGSAPRRLTNMSVTGTPRWSPDSQWIAFDSDGNFGHSGIYVISVEGGPARPIVDDGANNSVPSWSHDGKWMYFASNRSTDEQDQVWKVSLNDGRLAQVTRQGGFSAYESTDGRTLYYAKSRYPNPEIWQVPVDGGAETRVSALLRPTTWANWALTEQGIWFLGEYNEHASDLQYFSFADRSVRSLATLNKASFWLSASNDGSSIWYSELTDDQARLAFKAGW